MTLSLCALALAVALAEGTSAKDPALARGIALVREGEFEAAVLTLDRVVRRLAASPRRDHDLTLAYLYLGIAYLELDQSLSARARFREALALEPGMRLDPRSFSPQVIRAFEATRQDAAPAVAAAPPPAAGPEPSPLPAPTPSPEPQKRRSAVPWIIAGGGAAVAGVAAAAVGGGTTTTTTTTIPTPSATTTTTTTTPATTTTTSTTTTTTTLPPSGCRYDLSPRTQSVPASGGGGTCQVSVAPANCRWTAESTDTWLQPTTPSGTGNGQVMFLVMANVGNARRGRIRLVDDRSAQCEIEQAGR